MRQSVNCRILRIASDKTILHEMCFDGFDGTDNASIARWKKSDQRHHQEAGVQMLGAVVLHKGIEFSVEALLANLLVDGLSKCLPAGYVPENQPCSADFIARSTATHAIILE